MSYENCEVVNKDIKLKKEKLYSIYLENIGNVYEFTNEELDLIGYVIEFDNSTKEEKWNYEIVEITLNEVSPYVNPNLDNIYFSYGNYFEYDGVNIYDTLNQKMVDYNLFIDYIEENVISFSSGSYPVSSTEEYLYTNYSSSQTELQYGFPYLHTDISDLGSNCSPTAGTSIIMYWDLYHSDLISQPAFNPLKSTMLYPYYYVYDYKNWDTLTSSEKTRLGEIHDDLWYDMNSSGGTLDYYFYNALQDYFDNENLDLTRNIIAYHYFGGTVPWDDYTDEIDDGRPVVIHLFQLWFYQEFELMESYSINYTPIPPYIYTIYGNYDLDEITFNYMTYSGAHTVVGFGYKTMNFYSVNFYGNSYLVHSDNFMIIANGWGEISYINSNSDAIYKAYGIYPTN